MLIAQQIIIVCGDARMSAETMGIHIVFALGNAIVFVRSVTNGGSYTWGKAHNIGSLQRGLCKQGPCLQVLLQDKGQND